MDNILKSIMEFINNNTLILIGICVFLILVLIGYLIDNSVKSKRVRNDIKNAAQVPEKIKDEIIREAEEKKEPNTIVNEVSQDKKEDSVIIEERKDLVQDTPVIDNNNVIQTSEENKDDINSSLNLDSNISNQDINASLDLDSTFSNASPINIENTDNNDINSSLNLDSSINNIELDKQLNKNESAVDPDAYLINDTQDNVEYSNNKKLSEILSGMNKNEQKDNNANIFTTNTQNVSSNDSDDELDRIMRKLSSMNNNVQDDNYTNIF